MNIEQFDYNINLLNVILWQYNQATNLLSLLNQKQAWYDVNQTEFWTNWYNQVFNLSPWNTEITTFGLAVWSIILDVPLFVPVAQFVVSDEWGFNEIPPVNTYVNFTNAPFPPTTPLIFLTAPQQQFLLLLKYFDCTTRATLTTVQDSEFVQSPANEPYYKNFIYNINSYLTELCLFLGEAIGYPNQTIYCYDNLDMTITYVYSDPLLFPSNLARAIALLDLYPRPTGVKII